MLGLISPRYALCTALRETSLGDGRWFHRPGLPCRLAPVSRRCGGTNGELVEGTAAEAAKSTT